MALHRLVNGWIKEFEAVTNSEDRERHANQLLSDSNLIDGIFSILQTSKYHDDLLESVCEHLTSLYRTGHEKLQQFVIGFLPALMEIHLVAVVSGVDKKKYHYVEVLLLSIYNIESVDEDGHPIVRNFRIPILTKPSVYHEPHPISSIHHSSTMQLTETALHKHETGAAGQETLVTCFGPYQEIDSIVAGNRMHVMTVLTKIYNRHITNVPQQSLVSLSTFCQRTLPLETTKHNNSFNNSDSDGQAKFPCSYMDLISNRRTRIQFSSTFLVELSYSVYFALFNNVIEPALEALDLIHERALYSMYPDVLLMTNAIRNSLEVNPSGQPRDGPMGISLALSPTSTTVVGSTASGVSKTAITNASFRTRKLPDDIPIVINTNNTNTNTTNTNPQSSTQPALSSINEDEDGQEQESTPKEKEKTPKILTGSKAPVPGLGKMHVMQKLREKKEKRREIKELKKQQMSGDSNGDVRSSMKTANKAAGQGHPPESGFESEASGGGTEEWKPANFADSETIPLTTFVNNKPTAKRTPLAPFERDEDSGSTRSSNSDAATVPLISQDSPSQQQGHPRPPSGGGSTAISHDQNNQNSICVNDASSVNV